MNRQEKKAIRLEISHILDKGCKPCHKVEKNSYRTHPYCHEKCPMGKRLLELSGKLESRGENIIVQPKAGRPKGNKAKHWTDEEVFYLINHFYILTIEELAKKLNRTETSIEGKVSHLRKQGKWVPENVR